MSYSDYLANAFGDQQHANNDKRVAVTALVTQKFDDTNGTITVDSFDGGVHEFPIETGAAQGDTIAVVQDENSKYWAISPSAAPGTGGGGPTEPSGYETNPIGTVITFTGMTLPDGWVLADGATYTEADHQQGYDFASSEVTAGNPLWTVDTTATTFTVPDLRDKFLYSEGANPLGANGGEVNHTLSTSEMPWHNHSGATGPDINYPNNSVYAAGGTTEFVVHTYSGAFIGVDASKYVDLAHIHGIPAEGGGVAHNTMPPYVVLAFMVKVSGIVVIGSDVVGPPGPQGDPGPVGPPGPIGTVTDVVAARAYCATAFTLPGADYAKIPLDTVDFDNGSNFQIANSQYVCPQTGYYLVSGQVQMVNTPENAVEIRKNGVTEIWGTDILANGAGITVSDIVSCAAGDYLELWAYSQTSVALVVGGSTSNYLSVTLLSAGPKGDTGPAGPEGPAGSGSVQSSGMTSMSVNYAVPAGQIRIPFDTSVCMSGGMYMYGGKMVVPVTGLYRVSAQVTITPDMPAGRIDLYIVNGGSDGMQNLVSIPKASGKTAGIFESLITTSIISASAGDMLSILIDNQTGTAGTIYGNANWTTMSVESVSS